jgi:hypothetical protein
MSNVQIQVFCWGHHSKFTKSLTVALPIDVYQKIKEITDDEKISMAKWVRKAVDLALEGDAVEEE